MNKQKVRERIAEIGVVPVVRASSSREALIAAEAVCQGGIPIVEITMTVPGAVEVIRELSKSSGSEVLIGAGTVLDPETARRCLDAGAQFLVSPGLNLPTVELAVREKMLIMAGALKIIYDLLLLATFHNVRPPEDRTADARHLPGIVQRVKCDELRLRGGLALLDEIGQREADPRNDHRPGFDAPMPVDPFLKCLPLQDVFEIVGGRLATFAVDHDLPRLGLERLRVLRWRVLVGTELIVVVVRGDLLPRVDLIVGGGHAQRALAHVVELAPVGRGLACGLEHHAGAGEHGRPGGRGTSRRLEELAPIQIELPVRDLGATAI